MKIYKVVNEKGQVLIPSQIRKESGIGKGDIVKLTYSFGKVTIEKVNIIEKGDMSEEAINRFVDEAIKILPESKSIDMATYILKSAQTKERK